MSKQSTVLDRPTAEPAISGAVTEEDLALHEFLFRPVVPGKPLSLEVLLVRCGQVILASGSES